jgi:hypothetical protein
VTNKQVVEHATKSELPGLRFILYSGNSFIRYLHTRPEQDVEGKITQRWNKGRVCRCGAHHRLAKKLRGPLFEALDSRTRIQGSEDSLFSEVLVGKQTPLLWPQVFLKNSSSTSTHASEHLDIDHIKASCDSCLCPRPGGLIRHERKSATRDKRESHLDSGVKICNLVCLRSPGSIKTMSVGFGIPFMAHLVASTRWLKNWVEEARLDHVADPQRWRSPVSTGRQNPSQQPLVGPWTLCRDVNMAFVDEISKFLTFVDAAQLGTVTIEGTFPTPPGGRSSCNFRGMISKTI